MTRAVGLDNREGSLTFGKEVAFLCTAHYISAMHKPQGGTLMLEKNIEQELYHSWMEGSEVIHKVIQSMIMTKITTL